MTPEERKRIAMLARELYSSASVSIDADKIESAVDGFWVSSWVFVPSPVPPMTPIEACEKLLNTFELNMDDLESETMRTIELVKLMLERERNTKQGKP